MNARPIFRPAASCLLAAVTVAAIFLASPVPRLVAADERGTVGLVLKQIYDDQKPDHRGPLAVMHVMDDSPAAKAGIHCSDFIVAVNGVPTPGCDVSDIVRKDFWGPVDGTVHVTVVRLDGSQSEITLVRAPYPLRTNPASDPFAYSVPGSWAADSRYAFPLPAVSRRRRSAGR